MKQKIIIVLIFLLIVTYCFYFQKKENLEPVFSEKGINSIDEYRIYNLDVENLNVSTKTLEQYFFYEEVKVLGVYPKLNNLYKNKLFGASNYYAFTSNSIYSNLKNFESHFKRILQTYGLKEEISKIELEGISIKRVKIYTSNKIVNKILKNNPKFKIS